MEQIKEVLNKNMRRLKRIKGENGLLYTMETDKDRARCEQNLLCEYCAWNSVAAAGRYPRCSKYSDLLSMREKGLLMMVRSCAEYQPILTFRPPVIGTDGVFNTFRFGDAWFKRLTPGTICGLVNLETEEVFAKAEVTAVEQGDFEELCEKHARFNHTQLLVKPDLAAERLKAVLRSAYGVIATVQTRATVIYLRNLESDA